MESQLNLLNRPYRVTLLGLAGQTVAIITLLGLFIYSQFNTFAVLNGFVSVWLHTIILFGVPGFLVANLLFSNDELPFVEKIVLSLTFGLALLLIPAVALLLLQAPFSQFTLTIITINGTLAIANVGRIYLRSKTSSQMPNEQPAKNGKLMQWSGALLFMAAIVCLTFAALLYLKIEFPLYWQPRYDDKLQFMPYVTQYAESPYLSPYGVRYLRADVRNVFIGWLVLLGYISKTADVHPVDMYMLYLPPLVSIFSLANMFLFCKTLFRSVAKGLVVIFVQILYLAATLTLDSNGRIEAGYIFFYTNLEDRMFASILMLPIAQLFMLLYLNQRRKSYLVAFALFTIGLTLLNPLGYVFIGLSVTAFAITDSLYAVLGEVVLEGSRLQKVQTIARLVIQDIRIRFGPLFTVLVLPVPILFAQRFMFVSGGSLIFTPEETTSDLNELMRFWSANRHLLFVNGLDSYMAAPTLVEHPIIRTALFLLPLMFLHARRDQAARFLLSNMVLPLLLIYNPWTAPILGRLLGLNQIWRFRWMLPITLVLGLALWYIHHYARNGLSLAMPNLPKKRVMQIPLILMIVAPIVFVSPLIVGSVNYIVRAEGQIEEEQGHLREDLKDVLIQLDVLLPEKFPDRSWLLADTYTSQFLQSYSSRARAVVWSEDIDQFDIPAARHQISTILNASVIIKSTVEFLEKYPVSYILQRSNYRSTRQFRLSPTAFHLLYQNETFELYQVDLDRLSSDAVLGNTFLAKGSLDEAIHAYERALDAEPENALAHFGLARAYHVSGDIANAVTEYQRVADLQPHDIWLQQQLAAAYMEQAENNELKVAPYRGAIAAFEKVFALSPNDVSLHRRITQQLSLIEPASLGFDLLSRILAVNQEALDQNPEDLQRYLNLAALYEDSLRFENAIAVYKRTLEHWPDHIGSHIAIGNLYFELRNATDAEKMYKQALAIDSASIPAYSRLIDLYEQQGQLDLAITIGQEAAKHYPRGAWVNLELGRLYLLQASSTEE